VHVIVAFLMLMRMRVVMVVAFIVGVGMVVMVALLMVVFIRAAVFWLFGLDWVDLGNFFVSHPSDYGHSIWIEQLGKAQE
jgi:hypothetical protein